MIGNSELPDCPNSEPNTRPSRVPSTTSGTNKPPTPPPATAKADATARMPRRRMTGAPGPRVATLASTFPGTGHRGSRWSCW
jgi:hypothetical protein